MLRSDLKYDNVVVEHTAGVGGSAAKMIGEAVHRALTRHRPSLERELLARANAAIVQADHAAYAELTPSDVPGVRAIIDGRGILDPAAWAESGVRVRGIGSAD